MELGELSFAEQAKSITATMNNLQAVIEHHVEYFRRLETIEKCLAQIERLGQRLRGPTIKRRAIGFGSRHPSIEKVHRPSR